jgi:hypothetical protein
MDHPPFLCPHCATTTTLVDWEVVRSLEFIGVLAEHRGACGGQAWLFPSPPTPQGTQQIEAHPVQPVPAAAPRPVITAYARICDNWACTAEGLPAPLEEDEDLRGAARCPSCDGPWPVYARYQVPGSPMGMYEPLQRGREEDPPDA